MNINFNKKLFIYMKGGPGGSPSPSVFMGARSLGSAPKDKKKKLDKKKKIN